MAVCLILLHKLITCSVIRFFPSLGSLEGSTLAIGDHLISASMLFLPLT